MSVPTTAAPRVSELSDAALDRLRMSLAQLRCELDAQMRAASATLQELREESSLTDPDVQAPLMTALHALDAAERTSVDVVDALARMDAGTYGVCPRCRRAIPLARLEVRPAVRFCLDCSG